MNKRAIIPKLVNQLYFLSDDRKEKIINEYKVMTELKLEKIYNFLVSAIAKQEEIVSEEISKNPNLVSEHKSKIVEKYLLEIHRKENLDIQKNLSDLKSLELELKSL